MRKGLGMEARKGITKGLAEEYGKRGKKGKGEVLDRLVAVTGYHRQYGSWLLRNWGRKVVVWRDGQRLVYAGERRGKRKRKRRGRYDAGVKEPLRKIWYCLDCPCGNP